MRKELYWSIFNILRAREGQVVTLDELHVFIINWQRSRGKQPSDDRFVVNNMLKVLIHKVRTNLLKKGATVENIHGVGYTYRRGPNDKRKIQIVSGQQHLGGSGQTTA